ncbi:MAG: CdaR family protein [Thermodesulfovibrionales bacterium]|nr:CdaR family protein [Thermodesulfovibrionales bacterium]
MRKLLLENMGMKIAAVVMAITLWFFVTSRGQSEVSMDVPIELKNIPSGFESVRQGIKTVSVSIKGQERLLRNMKPAAVRVHVDLSKAKKGKGTYYINNEDVKLPSTMTVTNISPSSVMVALEETVIRKAPVQAVVLGTPKKGFFVGSVEVNPREMTIEGARSEVSRIKSLRTEPVDITDMDETSVQEVRLDLGGRNIRTEVQEVNVKVVIKK